MQDKQRVHESLRPASSRTKFGLVSASFPSSAFEGGKLVEFTVCFHGIPGASISLQDQALQFLETWPELGFRVALNGVEGLGIFLLWKWK